MTTHEVGTLAIVLHAHLPFVHRRDVSGSLEERWLFEALWECYLPLLAALERLERDGVPFALTWSVSPTLAWMLDDATVRARFEQASREQRELGEHLGAYVPPEQQDALAHARRSLASALATWDAIGGDVLGRLVSLARSGRLALATTSATHAYLPALASRDQVVAQLRLGRRLFRQLTGVSPRGLWLPECGYDGSLSPILSALGVGWTVLDGHGVTLATPRAPRSPLQTIVDEGGTTFFGRDPTATRAVWSREVGYPGDPAYRDFYRDVGFDLPLEALRGFATTEDARRMTGFKLHRITGPSDHKLPYVPADASARAAEHARHFVRGRVAALERGRELDCAAPVSVAPYDAELFGHWWAEGPEFLEQVFRELHTAPEIRPVTLDDAASEGTPVAATPSASSWGEGGYGSVWTNPRTAPLWRHVHNVGRVVAAAARRGRGWTGQKGRALDQAIRELALLQASDWAFMLDRGEMEGLANARVHAHVTRALTLVRLAERGATGPDATEVLARAERDNPFAHQLRGEELRGVFDDVDA